MEIEFDDPELDRLYFEPTFTGGRAPAIVKGYRKAVGFIRQASDERDLRAMKGLNFHPLRDDREGQHSINLNDQWRLILEIRGEGKNKRIGVIEIVDYH